MKKKNYDTSNLREDYEQDSESQARARHARRIKRQRRALLSRIFLIVILLLAAAGAGFLLYRLVLRDYLSSGTASSGITSSVSANNPEADSVPETAQAVQTELPESEAPTAVTEAETDAADTGAGTSGEISSDAQSMLDQAALLAAGYDYDGAIELIQSYDGYETLAAATDAISEYQSIKETCVAVDVYSVPHIFYHSLINNTDAAFNVSVLGQGQVDGMNAWMTTVDEFDKITQQMYDNGYVFVSLHDLVTETVDADGTVHFSANTNLMLPPGKKAVVLSVDDLSYYHSYEAASFPDKLVLDENGLVKCHYVTPDGTEEVGDFDVVPRLNTFLREHPDGAYKGARGTIALTGYNGVFGYRTDQDYVKKEHLMADQAAWLDAHPDFDHDTEVAEATKIANALKEEGWDFASHTWGHLSVTNKTVDELKKDNEKWVENVGDIVGSVDTIIFAHGNDIGTWEGYSSDNEKYAYFKSVGYRFFCNVDSSTPAWVQITDEYVRQGRIDLDGYQLYLSSIGETTVLDGLFKASTVFDQNRPTPVVANGES